MVEFSNVLNYLISVYACTRISRIMYKIITNNTYD